MKKSYDVLLLDKDLNVMACQLDMDTLKEAKVEANRYLKDMEYSNDAFKVEIRDAETEECLWDKFVKRS